MKKLFIFLLVLIIVMLSVVTVGAEDQSNFCDLSGLYNSLSDEAREHMHNIGADSADADALSKLSFDGIMNEIAATASQNASAPLKGLISVIAILLICSMLSAYKNSLSADMSSAINTVCALCVSCAVCLPAVSLIKVCSSTIVSASNLMLAYAPVIVVILAVSGSAVSSGVYYTSVVAAGEGVMQISSNVIMPFLNIFLALSISSGLSYEVKLKGLLNLISKAVKYLLTFVMAIFTAVLSVKQLISSSLDTVTGRAVKFAISSFVPIVGSALADAYKTVQGSVSLLKSGVGVFVILAVGFVFLPVGLQCILWQFSIWIGKFTAEALNLPQAADMLEGLSAVFSVMLATILCSGAVYIISTAAVFSLGGAGS